MSRGSECSRLRQLMDHHLRRYTEKDVISPAKENEKDLLISLSQVLREIQLWTDEIDNDSGAEMVGQLVNDEESTACCSVPLSEERQWLARIVADSIGLLSMKNPYVQHLVGNILVKISEFLAESGNQWDVFIHLLNNCVEFATIKILPHSAVSSANGFKETNSGLSSSNVLRSKLENANWFTVASAFRVLRNILKHLSQEDNDDLLDVYLKSISYTLANIPWCLLDEICFYENGDVKENSQFHTLALGNITGQGPRIIFLGDFIQFLCSLVQQSRFQEDCGGSENTDPILPKIINLVPNLLHWCLPKQESSNNSCISRYLRHKLLVLMIRLSYQSDLECSTLVSWLQLLHLYFQDLLQQPLIKHNSAQDDCLDGSPFLSSFDNREIHETHSNHLQRLAVFLFLKCSLSLISSKRYAAMQYEHQGREKGLQDLCDWIQRQIPGYGFADHEMHIEKRIEFSMSFIRLYMHEDDLLFKILLQLLSMPFCGVEQLNKEKLSLQDDEQVILFHVSTVFNPVNLFHIFLSELQYDHQVLLDYLISKDIGVISAEYLLRCLRTVCESWDLFVKFPLGERTLDVSSSKKRKVLPDGLDVEAGLSSPISVSFDDQHNWKHHRTGRHAFQDAKKCLLGLKSSIESLFQKNLFPYNPEVLLKRLMRFEELCFNK